MLRGVRALQFLTGGSDNAAKVRKLFDLIDEDHSGAIDQHELVHALRHDEEAADMAEHFPALRALLDSSQESAEQRRKRHSSHHHSRSHRHHNRKKKEHRETLAVLPEISFSSDG